MSDFWPLTGDLHLVLAPRWAGLVLLGCSALCGLAIGLERETKRKPAGLRTMMLICLGSTVFTLCSLLFASSESGTDRTRIAAQVVTGVGFLGAGALIRDGGTVLGMTTAATVWVVAAIGMLIGGGYALGGLLVTVLVLATLTVVHRFEVRMIERCQLADCSVTFQNDGGKTFARLLSVLDAHGIEDPNWNLYQDGQRNELKIRYCHYHREHRAILAEIADVIGVVEIVSDAAAPRERQSVRGGND